MEFSLTNPGNQLIFNVYFKGRALMIKNSLYLTAMECEIQNNDEAHFKQFIDSFKLHADGGVDTKL